MAVAARKAFCCHFRAFCDMKQPLRMFSAAAGDGAENSCKVVIVGGGSGGATMAARLSTRLGRKNVLVIEPSEVHYYQPYWTLVGGGIVDFETSYRPMASVLPRGLKWVKERAVSFHPDTNVVQTESGKKIKYDYLIVAVGFQLGFEKIKGLPEAFETPGVCSNYSADTVKKTAVALKEFRKGNAVFTQPVAPIKCAGAPQKIAYLADDYFRRTNKRDNADIIFCTAMSSIFSAPKYAEALCKVAQYKNIKVNYGYNLVEVKADTKEAVFEVMDKETPSYTTIKYEMLHVTPPMFPPDPLKKSVLCDSTGYLDVSKFTLQHSRYPNVFGIGDCTNVPTSKTAAAVAGQCGILTENIIAVMEGKPAKLKYDGYTSCPLVTGNKKGIIAEFDFDLKPRETLPLDQGKERHISYIIKKNFLPFIYWNMMLRGYWKGPGVLRRLLHLGRR